LSGVIDAIAADISDDLRVSVLDRLSGSSLREDGLATGKCGRIASLSRVATTLAGRDLKNETENAVREIVNRFEQTGDFNLYTNAGFPCIGLFYGTSGIGYQLLTLYENNGLPDPLTFSF
jgi:lantibiotic modifying enzyme